MNKMIFGILEFLLRALSLSFMLFYASFAVFYGARLALKGAEPITITIGDNIVRDSTFYASDKRPGLVVGGDE